MKNIVNEIKERKVMKKEKTYNRERQEGKYYRKELCAAAEKKKK